MACFRGLLGERLPQRTEIVRPEGLEVVAKARAEKIHLHVPEQIFAEGPLDCASYPAIAFRIGCSDEAPLRAGLAKALVRHPAMAGRLVGATASLTHEGVPFSVVRDPGASAPDFTESMLSRFADFRCPLRVRRGLEPLMTVKFTRFKDGSAVLAICRSHGLMDGTSFWVFMADWAQAVRGKYLSAADGRDRSSVEALLPDDDELNELAEALGQGKPKKSMLAIIAKAIAPPLINCMDLSFLSGMSFPDRHRLFLSHGEVARIKEAATPVGGKGWVSTQEALAAYLMLTVARAVLPASSKGRVGLVTILDPRRALGLPEHTRMGAGIVIMVVKVQNILQKSLVDVAREVHEESQASAGPEAQAQRWRFTAGCAERDMFLEGMRPLMNVRAECDLTLKLNNQSKRVLPDFGRENGGCAKAVVSNAGPTLILPREGGIEIWLCPDFVGCGRKALKALDALQSQLPLGPKQIKGHSFRPAEVVRA